MTRTIDVAMLLQEHVSVTVSFGPFNGLCPQPCGTTSRDTEWLVTVSDTENTSLQQQNHN